MIKVGKTNFKTGKSKIKVGNSNLKVGILKNFILHCDTKRRTKLLSIYISYLKKSSVKRDNLRSGTGKRK